MTEAAVPKKVVRRRRRIHEAIVVVPRSRLWWNTAGSVLVLLGIFGMGYLVGRRSAPVEPTAVHRVPEARVPLALNLPKPPESKASSSVTAGEPIHAPTEALPAAKTATASVQNSEISALVPGATPALALPGGYGVQLGAYPTRRQADAAERRYQARSSFKWPAYVVPYAAGDGQAWYRVRVGHFESRRQAKSALKALIRTFPGAIVVRLNESGS